jgi:hypothetical protein
MADRQQHNIVDAILELKGRDPFVPFDILLTSGDRHRIESGSNLVEMHSEFFYAAPHGDGFVFLRKNQIAAVERPDERRTTRRKAS